MAIKDKKYGFGWLKDKPDLRDVRFSAPKPVLVKLPKKTDLRTSSWSPPYDQGSTNSCTANAIAFLYEFARAHQGLAPKFLPSRTFIYWNEREVEQTTATDDGAYLRDGMKSINTVGVCPEESWPFSKGVFERPSDASFSLAQDFRSVAYTRITHALDDMKACLAGGFPFAFGFVVYPSLDQAEHSGAIPLPYVGETPSGGHAVVAVGYDDDQQRVTFRNSWGSAWGEGGYGTIPYKYLTDPTLSDDFWALSLVTPKLPHGGND